MRWTLCVIVCVVLQAVAADDAVIALDATNFQFEVDNKDILLVCFFHSKSEPEDNISDEFLEAAKRIQGKGPVLGAVDCAYEKTLQRKYEIDDFPAIRLFR